MSQFWCKAIQGTAKKKKRRLSHDILESQRTTWQKKNPYNSHANKDCWEQGEYFFHCWFLLLSERDKGDVWPMLGCAALSRTTLVKMSHTVWIQASQLLLQRIFFFFLARHKNSSQIILKEMWVNIEVSLSGMREGVEISSGGEMFLWCKQGDASPVSSGIAETRKLNSVLLRKRIIKTYSVIITL